MMIKTKDHDMIFQAVIDDITTGGMRLRIPPSRPWSQ